MTSFVVFRSSTGRSPPQPVHPVGGCRQRGMTLITTLVILAVLTLLGVTSMTSTGMEEKMATNVQEYTQAFQAAESGISSALKLPDVLDASATQGSPVANSFSYRGGKETATTANWYQAMGRAAPPGYSMDDRMRAHYFAMTSAGASVGGGSSVHNRGYYIIGPGL